MLDIFGRVIQDGLGQWAPRPVRARMRLGDVDFEQFLNQAGIAQLRRHAKKTCGDLGVEYLCRHCAGRLVNDLDILPR